MKTATALGCFFLLNAAAVSQPNLDSLGAALVAAVKAGDLSRAREFLGQWTTTGKPWPLGPDDKPLLFLAIEGREKTHPEMIELLLENGADVETRGPEKMTALHWAASHGYPERTDQILRHHPALEARDDRERTPLLVAHAPAAEKLLAAGANLLAVDRDGMCALHYAAQDGGHHLEVLARAGFKFIDVRSKAGLTPLHVAALEGTESAAEWLLDHGANAQAEVTSDYDYLPRDLALGYGYEIRVRRGATALRLAAKRHEETKWSTGHYRAVLELLKKRTR